MNDASRSRHKVLVAVALGVLALAGVVTWYSCTSSLKSVKSSGAAPEQQAQQGEQVATQQQAARSTPTAQASPQGTVGEGQGGTSGATVSETPATTPAPEPATQGSVLSRAMKERTPADHRLFSEIERQLHRDPPPEIHRMLELRQKGAGREELERFIEEQLPPDALLRRAARDWLDEVLARPGEAPPARPELKKSTLQKSPVKRLQPTGG